jgi:hypothetical protein
MPTPDRESCHELTKTDRLRKKIQQNEEELFIVRYKYDGEMQAYRGWLIQYDTYEIMLSGNEPEESVSIPYDWIEELEIENRRITQIPYDWIKELEIEKRRITQNTSKKNPQKEDDDLNVLPSMKLKSS